MNSFSLTITNIQHVKYLQYDIDLTKNTIHAILGKNGIGKTILFKAIQNLVATNTFKDTSNKYIYSDDSNIEYTVDGISYNFTYDEKIETLNSFDVIDSNIKKNIYAELPIPFGNRFNQFKKLGSLDSKLREKLIVGNYNIPEELIQILNYIYDTSRFDSLREFTITKNKYYMIELDNSLYIREDYLSSAEYFIINIYKSISRGCKLIAIDEIDISLDSMAQVRLVISLRKLAREKEINILFSTHSLALIKMLEEPELLYMDNIDGTCSFEYKSYNHIKALLYGFQGYDKYILTEDKMLEEYIKNAVKNEPIFSKYKIIYIGGASNTFNLMIRNEESHIFSEKENVITILDRDQKEEAYCNGSEDVSFIPHESIEKALKFHYDNGTFPHALGIEQNLNKNGKDIYNKLMYKNLMTNNQLFDFLDHRAVDDFKTFKCKLLEFLNT